MTEAPQTPLSGAGPAGSDDSWPRRLRLWVEGAWREGSQLAQMVLDSIVLPSGGFAAVAFGVLTSALLFALSLPLVAIVALGGLVVFAGLEALAILAYAFPGALFLASLAGGVAPPVIAYWALHVLLGVEGDWSRWGAWPLLLAGLYGSYYYWRFGRTVVATGENAVAFYRRSAPRAGELFLAPFALLPTVWRIFARLFAAVRRGARELLDLLRGARANRSASAPGASPESAESSRESGVAPRGEDSPGAP